MTFDNAEELEKIKEHYPEAELVIRVLADDSYSACRVRPPRTCLFSSLPTRVVGCVLA